MANLKEYLYNWLDMWSFKDAKYPVDREKFTAALVSETVLYVVCVLLSNVLVLSFSRHGPVTQFLLLFLSLSVTLSFIVFSVFCMRRYKSVGAPSFLAIPMFIAPLYIIKYLGVLGIILGFLLLAYHLYITLCRKETVNSL